MSNGALTAVFFVEGSAIRPVTDNTVDLGLSNRRFQDVWATNGVIQTSDERMKTAVAPTPLGLSFLRRLDVVRFTWADRSEPPQKQTRSQRRQKTLKRKVEREQLVRVGGRWVAKLVVETLEEPMFEIVEVFSEDGNSLGRRRVPVIEEITVEDELAPPVRKEYQRPHEGFSAQQVKKVLDECGIDAGLLIHDPESDSWGLRTHELLAVTVRGVQELADRVDALGTALAELAP